MSGDSTRGAFYDWAWSALKDKPIADGFDRTSLGLLGDAVLSSKGWGRALNPFKRGGQVTVDTRAVQAYMDRPKNNVTTATVAEISKNQPANFPPPITDTPTEMYLQAGENTNGFALDTQTMLMVGGGVLLLVLLLR